MSNHLKIIAIGAATQDVFLTGKALAAKRDLKTHGFVEQFPSGAKLDLEGIVFDTGGGGANAAVTFARQGIEAEFVGKVGHDPAGAEVLRVLRKEGVGTGHVAIDTKFATAYAAILLSPSGERTILGYRGASHNLHAKDFAIRNFRADWLYITSLAGNIDLLKRLLKHANQHGIKVALNPGQAELKERRKLKALLPLVTVFMANREEYQQLFNLLDPRDLMAEVPCAYAVLTDGAAGSLVSDGEKLYAARQYQNVRVVDRTGAGDAFGSGFVAALAQGLPVVDAITLGSANSTAVVQKVGAKSGILRTSNLKRMRIKVTKL